MLRLALSVLGGLACASAIGAFDDWPQWRGPNRDRVSAEKGLLDQWDKTPTLRWIAKELGVGYSGAAIDRGLVLTMRNRNGKMMVIAVNDKNGNEIWGTEIGPTFDGAIMARAALRPSTAIGFMPLVRKATWSA